MKNRTTVLSALVALLLVPFSLRAQNATPAQGKIGVINIQLAIVNTAEGKKAFADLQKKYQPRQQELQRLQQEIQQIQDQLSKQAATLSEEEQGRLGRDAEDKQKQLKRSAEDAQNDFNHDRDEAINAIGKKMLSVIAQYAQQNGFVLIIDGAQVPVYFAAKDIELTEAITQRYDGANPVADAAAPAKPASHTATPAAPSKPK
jgi:outer membrane protein